MNQVTRNNKTSNAAINAAKQNNRVWYQRANSNRWYVYKGERLIFGTANRCSLQDCKEFVLGYCGRGGR